MKQCIGYLNDFKFIEECDVEKKIIDTFLDIALQQFTFKAICGFSFEKYEEFKNYYTDKRFLVANNKKEELEDFKEDKNFERCIKYYKAYPNNWEKLEKIFVDYIYKLDLNKEDLLELLKEDRRLNYLMLREHLEDIKKDYCLNLKLSEEEEYIRKIKELLIDKKDLLSMFRINYIKEYIDYFEKDLKNDLLQTYIKKQLDTQDKIIGSIDFIDEFLKEYPTMKDFIEGYRNAYELQGDLTSFIDGLEQTDGFHLSKWQNIILQKYKNEIKSEIIESKTFFEKVVALMKKNQNFPILSDIIKELADENVNYKKKFKKLWIL
jgi:hypothetical protein